MHDLRISLVSRCYINKFKNKVKANNYQPSNFPRTETQTCKVVRGLMSHKEVLYSVISAEK
jgi:hypothetical protein